MRRLLILMLLLIFVVFCDTNIVNAQKEKKGDLEDFADDFGEEESDDSDDNDSGEFFLWLFFENIGDIAQLWGGTPETEFGPFPGFPYAENAGFMTYTDDFRSFFINTELNFHYINENLISYIFKWESQFLGRSKLSFDIAWYGESLFKNELGTRKDYLTFFGLRYGRALFRSPQAILNLEGGFRGCNNDCSRCYSRF